MKVIVSTGIGRLHLVQSALWLKRCGVDICVIQGWVPSASSFLLSIAGRLIGHSRLAYGMKQRRPPELKGCICACPVPEFTHQVFMRLARKGIGEHWRSASRSWRFFGWCSRRHIGRAAVFHVRSGAGRGGAIRKARKAGCRIVVDHSIAHPGFMEQYLRGEYQRNGQDFGFGLDNPFWRMVLEDCEDADILLVNSDFVKDTFIRAGYPAGKIRVVYLGVRPDFIGLKSSRECCPRRGNQMPFQLLFTGGFGFRKGAEYLLEALRILLKRKADVFLTVVGSNEEARDLLVKYAAESANIKLVGHVPQDDLKNYLAAADLYVFPSLAEGCASSGMEALAAGLCVVSTFESGLPIEDGKTGYIVPARDAAALADKIEWLIHHPDDVERAGRAASRLIQEQYTWEHYAQGVSAIYRELSGTVPDHDAGS